MNLIVYPTPKGVINVFSNGKIIRNEKELNLLIKNYGENIVFEVSTK